MSDQEDLKYRNDMRLKQLSEAEQQRADEIFQNERSMYEWDCRNCNSVEYKTFAPSEGDKFDHICRQCLVDAGDE